jgi:hypothetical protein
MAANFETLQAQVLSLSKADRSRLLARLIASLDVDPTAEEAWERQADAPGAELDSGVARPVAIEDAMARLRTPTTRTGIILRHLCRQQPDRRCYPA